MTTAEQSETLDQLAEALERGVAWPGTTYALTYQQRAQRAVTALKALAPLGFVDDNEDGESPGFVRLPVDSIPGGAYRSDFCFDAAIYPSLDAALAAVTRKLADHFREQGRNEIRSDFRRLMGVAAPEPKRHNEDR